VFLVETTGNSKTKTNPGAENGKQPAAPVTYTFDNRAFIVRPVFKDKPAGTLSDVLLRLMRADFEES
jgi:hypothetical protein